MAVSGLPLSVGLLGRWHPGSFPGCSLNSRTVCSPAGRITLRKVGVPRGVANTTVNLLAENVGVTGMSGHINQEVNDHGLECGISPGLRPPRDLSDSIEFQRLESRIGVIGRAPEEIHYLLTGLMSRNPEIRIGVIVAVVPRSRNARRAIEAITQVSELHIGNMLDDAEQVGPGGDLWPTSVVFADSVELCSKGITLHTQIPMEDFFLCHDAIMADRVAARCRQFW